MQIDERLVELNDYVYNICLFTTFVITITQFGFFGYAIYHIPSREAKADDVTVTSMEVLIWFIVIYELAAGV